MYSSPSDTQTQAPEKESDTTPESESETESVDKEEAGMETAIVDNKILSPEGEPLKEGDKITVRVVKNYGEECEIECAPAKSDTTESNEDSEIEALSTKE